MRLLPRRPSRNRYGSSPLQTQLVQFGGLVIGILSAALLLCMGVLLYSTSRTAEILHTNHLHSSALQQLDTLLETADDFRAFPREDTRAQLDAAFAKMNALLQQFDDSRMPLQQRSLVRAILQTYDTYEQAITELYLFPDSQLGSRDFFVRFYSAQEAGGYINTYLKQLIQQSLADEQDSYSAQLRFIKCSPFLIGGLILLSVALLYWFALWLYRRIATPLFRLSDAVEALAKNEMALPDLPITSNDEIGTLTQNFNRMKNDCHTLMVTRAERDALTNRLLNEHIQLATAEQKLTAARFDALSNQINPHFLFNTLTLIIKTASDENADETKQLIQQLANLLRYNLYNTSPCVPLAQEMYALHQYFHIQEARFGGRIVFWIDCRIDADFVEIPSFTLQPLVENAIQHGIEKKSGAGQVRIRIEEQNGFVQITVTDNGAGMDRKTLDALRFGSYIPKRKDSGIGVGNVATRLKMLYSESSFSIFSLPGIGTCVRLVYPAVPPRRDEEGVTI